MSFLRHALALGTIGLIGFSSAAPSINVALRTAFGAPPYLVELLETAAEENATAYFPLLDRIADGYLDSATNDRDLYTKFRSLLESDGHLAQDDLSLFDYALSIRSTAPRIAAHYQYYNASILPTLADQEEVNCESWLHVPFSGQRYCSPDLTGSSAQAFGKAEAEIHHLPLDRVLGHVSGGRPSVLYADIQSEAFRQFHKVLSKTAREGKTSYVVRYKPSHNAAETPLTISGYGVEMALKRTDYIVIDDRQAEEEKKHSDPEASEATLSEEEVSDLRPLSSSELQRLGLKAASFVMGSDAPLDTLLKLSQDFPKHSSSIAATNVSQDFLDEHAHNRREFLPAGFNAMWINGVQIMARDIDAYALLERLRHERKMINGVQEVGLSGPEAIDLLSHEAITAAQSSQEVHRYDWRDDVEDGSVIIWMNDIEKDKRYAEWPGSATSLLQRTYPGQLPPVRKDVHNLVVPVDFSDFADVTLVIESLQSFVKRKVPIRFGLVPRLNSPAGVEQARTIYYLIDRYGLATALEYLEQSILGAGHSFGNPQQQYFTKAVEDRDIRKERTTLSLTEVLDDVSLGLRLETAQAYLARLGSSDADPPVFINGVPIPKTEEWLSIMSQRVSMDVRVVQQAVYEGSVGEEDYLPDLFLAQASLRRNPLVAPEDDKDLKHIDLGELPELADLPTIPANKDTIERELVHLTLVVDPDTPQGRSQLIETLLFQRDHDNVELALVNPQEVSGDVETSRTFGLDKTFTQGFMQGLLAQYDQHAGESAGDLDFRQRQEIFTKVSWARNRDPAEPISDAARTTLQKVVSMIGVQSEQKAFLINGRVVGPIHNTVALEKTDLEALLSYERKQRLLPAALAIQGLNLESKASSPLSFGRISNLIALSTVSDVPEGIFEAAPTVRTSIFKKWSGKHTTVHVGDLERATVQIYASIDPASEVAQRWTPIIKAIADLSGVYACLFLNPKDRLDEIPVKRFYRYVIDSKPTFRSDGAVQGQSAHFNGLPAEALLNIGMDLPPSWLVAPQETVYDLDNIKLSAVKSDDVEAVFELEHILIEGHSRDVTLGPPPRGVQLVLGTDLDPHFADTIIMANLGYFQFKANPGIYNLALQKGRSEEIFKIDSAGTLGYNAQPGDETTEIALMSFRGSTLFPRLSRKPGLEEEDVLESSKSALGNLAEGADKLLAQIGLKGPQASKYLSSAARLGAGLFGKIARTNLHIDSHADINIFSVASGHLYERMLNIMMVSVMKHTKHTVKFWFIEQFLSPSFKDFLPVMAEEYGFKFEMVTYKWPHWLRSQKEKQREIWGYKILFLDVLFPLDLDKVIFVDADQIVRTDMYELVQHDLQGAPYGFTPMCDSRTEMEGFRFWKQGYWKNFLKGLPYHISALYVVDLKKFRQIAAGDRLRQNYHQLSADPGSLSNLDQDLPNHMQMMLPIHSLPQEWLWCETWCSDESLKDAKTIDLCNNPQTKEPKLDRARRQVPEWTKYDDEIAAVAKRRKDQLAGGAGDATLESGEESIQERLQREDAEQEREKKKGHDEL